MDTKLIVKFLNESPDFAYGFEAGKLYQQIRDRVPAIEGYFMVQNLEQIKLMAQTLGYKITSLNIADGYFWLTLELADEDGGPNSKLMLQP